MERNALCWCGSNKKYKKCHWISESSQRTPGHAIEGAIRGSLRAKMCLAPKNFLGITCTRKIVQSHSISRAAALREIARAGHVYGQRLSFSAFERHEGRVVPELVGINDQSTFPGFCSAHDDRIFREIDALRPVLSKSFCCRLAYRAICKELYLKRQLQTSANMLALQERGRSIEGQKFIRSFASIKNEGMRAAVAELEENKSSLEGELEDVQPEWVHTAVHTNGRMPIVVSSLFQPLHTVSGEVIQTDTGKPGLEHVVFSAIPTAYGGIFVLSCRSKDRIARRFVDDALAIDFQLLPKYLVGLAFEMCENIAIRPEWWETLEPAHKDAYISAMNHGILFQERPYEGEQKQFYAIPVDVAFAYAQFFLL
jgi:hypothetical protein